MHQHPAEVVNLKLQKQYDNAKWRLYCMHCDDTLLFTTFSGVVNKDVTYGSLNLEFDHLEIKGDTIELDFFFYYKDRRVDRKLVEYTPTWGVVLKSKYEDSVIEYSSRRSDRYFMYWCDSSVANCKLRTVNPLQPEVIEYIRKNKDKLDPWFRKEAIKRGVISD